ncbi:MAG: cupin domain-containing protein [Bacteroides sp.]|nr:cupin domain-containing protein [Bacteroides sp.]
MKKTRSETFIPENKTEWETIGDGVKRQILGYDGQLMMVKIKAEKKGPVGVEHAHYHSQVTFVSSGKFEFTTGGEKKIVSSGDGMYMEPDVRHSCICIEPGIIIDCFSPMREDFLKK